MAKRPCIVCGVPTSGSRCASHSLPARTAAERDRRKQVVVEWVAANGWICPGWLRPEHPSRDLTADHPIAVASGGAMDQPLAVLCRSCNASKGGGSKV